MRRSVWLPCILLSLCASGAATAQQRTLTLAEAVRLAQEGNPDVRLLAAEIDAARARLAGASLLLQANPAVTATTGPRSSPAGRSRDESFQVLQQLEIGGQRGARIDAAQATLDAAEARFKAARAEVTAAVREAFGRALAARQRAQLAAEALAAAQQGVAAAQERFEAGAAALLELNTARVEVGRMARERGEAERRSAEALGELHLLLGLDPAEALAPQGELGVGEPTPEEAPLIEEALRNRAEIAASRHALDAATAEARLAAREWLPSPRIGASYSREEESDTSIVQGILSFDLPLFNRNQAARGAAAARVIQLETTLEATLRRVRQEVSTALARLHAARAAADGYASDVVKAMEENLELGTESYRAGKIDFLQLLLVRRQTLEARHEYLDVLEELNAAQAQLDRALGRSD
jgi:cobalt-zinc-cadmium efflux system outer membrane protein